MATISTSARVQVVSVTGYCYEGKAQINTSLITPTGYGYGWAMTPGCAAATSAPPGYFKVEAVTYRNGITCSVADTGVNATASSSMSIGAAKNCGTGNYYASGYVVAYRYDTGNYYQGFVSTSGVNF